MPIHYRCPLCQDVLEPNRSSLKCKNLHCFDKAKEGYVNLLPVQNKKSKSPGDSSEMIQARKRFLSQGYYDGFVNFLISELRKNNRQISSLIDIGCGEGFYTEKLQQAFQPESVHGIDISKPAVRLSAKRVKSAHFSVASAFELPYFENSFEKAVSIFSPISLEECARVLCPGGELVIAGPGPNHLKELAEHIYQAHKPHEGNTSINATAAHLELKNQSSYAENIRVNGTHLLDLLTMTPYLWSCSEDRKQALAKLPYLDLHLDFVIAIYKSG